MEYLKSFKSRFEDYFKKTREVPTSREGLAENLLTTRNTTRAQLLAAHRNISEDLIVANDQIEDQTTSTGEDDSNRSVAAIVCPTIKTSLDEESFNKENKEQNITVPDLSTLDETANSSFQATGTLYFHTILNNETSRLISICKTWNTCKECIANLPENAKDLIDVAVGQANLLINKKFQQFRKLIISCENGYGEEKQVTCEDLQGFWDMVYIQVENLNTRFNCLTELKNNNWREMCPVPQKKINRKVVNRKRIKSSATPSLRATIEDAKKNDL